MKRKGFTLIELLVVIAIIAIIASILFPVFARARENARRSSCQSNLKQMGLGFAQYIQDYDGQYPRGCDANNLDNANSWRGASSNCHQQYNLATNPTYPYEHWMDKLMPYIKSKQIFSCPSATSIKDTAGTGTLRAALPDSPQANGTSVPDANHVSVSIPYGYNCEFIGGCSYGAGTTPVGGLPAKESQIAESARTIVVTESGYWNSRFGLPYLYSFNLEASAAGGTWPVERHFDGANLLFADGHVKWLKASAALARWTSNLTTAEADANPDFLWNRR